MTFLRQNLQEKNDILSTKETERRRIMEVNVRKINNSLYISLDGEIDHHEAAKIRDGLDDLIFEERPLELIFDFSKIRFMDSSGLGLVLGRYRIIKELGGSVKIVGASEQLEKIFIMSGVDKIVKIQK